MPVTGLARAPRAPGVVAASFRSVIVITIRKRSPRTSTLAPAEICVPGITPHCACREGHCTVYEVRKLAKYSVTKEVPVRICTIEWHCPRCGAPDASPNGMAPSAPVPPSTPAPPRPQHRSRPTNNGNTDERLAANGLPALSECRSPQQAARHSLLKSIRLCGHPAYELLRDGGSAHGAGGQGALEVSVGTAGYELSW